MCTFAHRANVENFDSVRECQNAPLSSVCVGLIIVRNKCTQNCIAVSITLKFWHNFLNSFVALFLPLTYPGIPPSCFDRILITRSPECNDPGSPAAFLPPSIRFLMSEIMFSILIKHLLKVSCMSVWMTFARKFSKKYAKCMQGVS